MDLSRAVVEVIGARQVRIRVDEWTADVRVEVRDGRPSLVDLRVRRALGDITASTLARLPIRGITLLAAGTVWGAEETLYRMLATPLGDQRPRPTEGRSWSADHYQRVARVAGWASRSGRAHGPAACVADFWSVHVRTARRWLARAEALGFREG